MAELHPEVHDYIYGFANRFGWHVERPAFSEWASGWFLLFGVKVVWPHKKREERVTFLLLDEEVALATKAIDRLSRFPREWRRVQRQMDYIAFAPGASELRRPARLAFVSYDVAKSATEVAVELNELGLLGWHLQVGGGLSSTKWKSTVERAIIHSSWMFAQRLLAVEGDDLISKRVYDRFRHRGCEFERERR